MRAQLQAVADGDAPADFDVTYSDVQPLWGGVTLTLDAEGRFARTTHGPGGRTTETTRGRVSSEQVREMAALLVEIEAWLHHPTSRHAIPDEAIVTLTLRCGGEEATVWELHGDLERNARLVRVRDLLAVLLAVLTSDGPPA